MKIVNAKLQGKQGLFQIDIEEGKITKITEQGQNCRILLI